MLKEVLGPVAEQRYDVVIMGASDGAFPFRQVRKLVEPANTSEETGRQPV
jgi:hypothetical protein